ncbi:2995_t:CDS:2, partial [Dentiscutata erythropus]
LLKRMITFAVFVGKKMVAMKSVQISHLSKWTSGNYELDKIIHMSQLYENAKEWEIWRWIDYGKFKDIEYLAKGGFGSIWKAGCIDMPEELFGFYNSNQVALKKL